MIKLGTYKFVPETDVSSTGTVLHSRFVLTIKKHGEETEYFKARLVILGHLEFERTRFSNEAPTVSKNSVQTALAVIASFGFKPFSRDVSIAFLQSKDL